MSRLAEVLDDLIIRSGWNIRRDKGIPPHVRLHRGGTVTIQIPPHVTDEAYEAVLLHELAHVIAGDLAPKAWEKYGLPDADALNAVADAVINSSLAKRYDVYAVTEVIFGEGFEPILPTTFGLEENTPGVPYSRYQVAEAWLQTQKSSRNTEKNSEAREQTQHDDSDRELQYDDGVTANDVTKAIHTATEMLAGAYARLGTGIYSLPTPHHQPKWVVTIRQIVGQLNYLASGYGDTSTMTRTWAREGRYKDLPGRARLPRMRIAVLLDCSGSTAKWHKTIQALAYALANDYLLSPTLIAFSDTPHLVTNTDQIKYGGGTAIIPALELARRHKPDFILLLTDGETQEQFVNHGVPIVLLLLPGRANDSLLAVANMIVRLEKDE